jgi:hypothetical protein
LGDLPLCTGKSWSHGGDQEEGRVRCLLGSLDLLNIQQPSWYLNDLGYILVKYATCNSENIMKIVRNYPFIYAKLKWILSAELTALFATKQPVEPRINACSNSPSCGLF